MSKREWCFNKTHNAFKYYRHYKLRKKVLFGFFALMFCLAIFIMYLIKTVNPVILSYGEAEVNRLLVKSSNNAILNISTINYDDLFTINYDDESGEVLSIISNSQTINNIANSLAIETQKELDMNSSVGINIPVGTLSGISFLSGRGHNISFSVNPLGNVTCEFFTTFSSVGINQTSHKIYIRINSSASLILPFHSKVVNKNIDYLISECLIIGRIPQTYLNFSSNISDLLTP